MITPKLIQILFYIGIIISGIIALVLFLSGGFGALLGLVVVLVGPIIVRVQCELLIIIFKIHEALEKISEK